MDLSLIFNSSGITLFGIFISGFVVGVIFWGLLRNIISKVIFFGIMVVLGLYLSGDAAIQSWVTDQLNKAKSVTQEFDQVANAIPGI